MRTGGASGSRGQDLWKFDDSVEDRLQHGFVRALVPGLKSHLGVTDDAHGVDDVGRSAIGESSAELRAVTVEYRVRDPGLSAELARLVAIALHRDRENEDAGTGVLLMEPLEMDHLLPTEVSVTREETDRALEFAAFAFALEHEATRYGLQRHRLAGLEIRQFDRRQVIARDQDVATRSRDRRSLSGRQIRDDAAPRLGIVGVVTNLDVLDDPVRSHDEQWVAT